VTLLQPGHNQSSEFDRQRCHLVSFCAGRKPGEFVRRLVTLAAKAVQLPDKASLSANRQLQTLEHARMVSVTHSAIARGGQRRRG